jgi:hypothetical protein
MGTYVSIHGRALGYDSQHGTIQRPAFSDTFDEDEGVSAASTSSTIKWRGASTITTTAAKAYTLAAPPFAALGCRKVITSISTSTAGASTITLASGTFVSTAGSSQNRLTFNNGACAVILQAVSTSQVQIISNVGAAALSTA